MPPYVPYIGLSRSQNIRLGRGPGNSLATEFNSGDTPTVPQTGALSTLFYADLGNSWVRKDLQHHSTLGAIDSVGSASNTTYTDLFKVDGLALTPSGSNMTVAVAAGNIQSRFYGSRLPVAAQTVTLANAPAFGGQTNYLYVNPAGMVNVYAGNTDAAAPTYEVWTVSVTGSVGASGTIGFQFQWNGITFTGSASFTTSSMTAATLATAIGAATGGPGQGGSTFAQLAAAPTGSGGPLPGTPAVITFTGAAEGPVVPSFFDVSAIGGTGVVSVTRTVGTGAATTIPSGNALVLGGYYVPAGTTNAAAATATGANLLLTA